MEKLLDIKVIGLEAQRREEKVTIKLVKEARPEYLDVAYIVYVVDNYGNNESITTHDNYADAKKTYNRYVKRAEKMAREFNRNTHNE